MKKLVNILGLVCMVCLLSCEKSSVSESSDADLEEVKIAVVLPKTDGEGKWDTTLKWVQDNIKEAGIGVKVVYELFDENTEDLAKLGETLTEREDIRSIVGCLGSENTMELAYQLARKKQNIKPLFTFSTSQELPRIFGHRGFLWGMCETDITQSEILLSCMATEFNDVRKVALLASDDVYGQTFVDWFAFQAVELGLEPVSVVTYSRSDELQSCLRKITDSGAQGLICVPVSVGDVAPVADYIYNWNMNQEEVEKLINLMFSDKAYDKAIFDSSLSVDNVTGMVPTSDPASGFSVSYQAKFGKLPAAGEAELYDAVMITCLATLWAEKHGEEDLNKAISQLLNQKTESQGGWTSGKMLGYYGQIMNGETPSISGATGKLDFNSEFYTTIRTTSYAHWMAYGDELVIIDHYSRNSGKHSSSPVAAWTWQKKYMQDLEDDGKEPEYLALEDNYAVLVAASQGWKNYRHQADVLGFYQYLKQNGFDDDHILLIVADDLAQNTRNPEPGVVRRELSGSNLYEGLEIDYKLSELTLADLKSILTAEPSEKYPVTLGSGKNDNVLFFWSGHGTPKGWEWKNTEVLDPQTASSMFADMDFRKMFAVIETCYAGSVAKGCVGIPGLLMMTAANAYEPSKADSFDENLQVYISNSFTSSILTHFDKSPTSSLYDLYLYAFDKTLGSHVTVSNAENYGSLYLNNFSEFIRRP